MKSLLLLLTCIAMSFLASATIGPVTGSSTVCRGSTASLADTTAGGTWSSSLPAVATIGSATGIVTGIGTGVTTITYSTGAEYATLTVTVLPSPAAISGTLNVCAGTTTTLTDASSGGAWSSSDGSVATTTSGGVVAGVATGTATISYTFSTGCAAYTTVTVNPLPAAIIGTTRVCVGSTTTLTDADAGGRWSNSNTNATIGSATGIVTGLVAGITSVSYILPSGCKTISTVTIIPLPSGIIGATTLCAGATTTYTDGITGGTWSSSNTSAATIGSSSGVVAGVSGGTAVITYTAGSGCFALKTLSVLSAPAPITGTLSVCIGQTTTLSDAVTGGTWSTPTTYASVGSSSGIVTGLISGTSVITYSIGTSCVATASVSVRTNPAAITGASVFCGNQAGSMFCSTTGGTWSSSNTAIATVGSVGNIISYTTGTATITYALGSGCYSTRSMTVYPAVGMIPPVANMCVGATAAMTDSTTGGIWSSSNSAIASVGSATGFATAVSAGTATITYNTGICFATRPVIVGAPPAAISGAASACVGATTTMTDATIGGAWSSSNTAIGSVNSAGVVGGIYPGTFTLSYFVSASGCTATKTMSVFATPAYIVGSGTVCIGNSVVMTNPYSGGVWSNSNTHVSIGSSTGLVTGITTGPVNITYTLPGSCSATMSMSVMPAVSGVVGVSAICPGSSTTFATSATGGSWVSSNTAVATVGSASGIATGIADGTSLISYTTVTGCAATKTLTVGLTPITGATFVYVGATTTLANATPGGSWSSSNTSVATVGSASGIVSGIASGTATITYMLSSGCFRTVNITVNPAAGAASLCAGATTTLTGSTGGGTWSSSNTAIATVGSASGVVTGISAGTAVITYTVGTGTETTNLTVNIQPALITGTVTLCEEETTALSDATSGGTWSSSNTLVANVNSSGYVTGDFGGYSVISYTLPTGCMTTTTVTRNAMPTIYGSLSVCEHTDGGLGGTDDGTHVTALWTSSDTSVATVSSIGTTYGASAGTAIITYALSPRCFATATYTVMPAPGAITGASVISVGSTATFINTVSGGTWSTSNSSVATVGSSTGIVTAIATGTAVISYTISTGCAVTFTVACTCGGSITGSASLCTGDNTTLTDTISGGTWSSRDTTVATIGSASGIITALSAGSTTITYTTGAGCYTTKAITVNTPPSAITGAGALCNGSAATVAATPSGGVWSTADGTVATVGSSTGTITTVGTGTTLISYTLSTGCRSIATISVNAAPTSISGSTSIPIGTSTTLSDATSGGFWSSSNNSIISIGSASGMATGVTTGTALISYTLINGCFTTYTLSCGDISCSGFSTPAIITTIAGYGVGGFSGDGGPATATELNSPAAVAVDRAGNTYVCDRNNNRIRKISASGIITTIAGTGTAGFSGDGGAATAATIRSVDGIAVDTSGNVYFSDYQNNRIRKISTSGIITTIAGSAFGSGSDGSPATSVSLGTPAGICIDNSGNLYFADQSRNRVRKVSPSGIITTVAGLGSSGYSGDGGPATAAQLWGPYGVCISASGGMYISERSNVRVRKVDPSGIITTIAGNGTSTVSGDGGAATAAGISFVAGITVDAGGNLYLSASSHSVRKVDNGGIISTIAGGTSSGYSGDGGPATSAQLNAPLDVKIDPAGNLIIAEVGNHAVRRISQQTAGIAPISGASRVYLTLTRPLSDATSGGAWSSSNSAVASVGSSSGIITGVSLGNAIITYAMPGGCFVTHSVNCIDTACPGTIHGVTPHCGGDYTILWDSLSDGVWTSSDASIASIESASGKLAAISAGIAIVSYNLGASCYTTKSVTINTTPSAISGAGRLCIGTTVTLSSSPSGGVWTSDNGNNVPNSTSGTVTAAIADKTPITYTLSNGCKAQTTLTVTPAPVSFPDTVRYIATGAIITFFNPIPGGDWSSSNASIASIDASSAIATGVAPGTATISYSMSATCYVTSSVVCTGTSCAAAISGPTSTCIGSSITLTDASSGGTWASTNPAVATIGSSSGIVTGISIGTAVISYYIASSGCYATAAISVGSSAMISTIAGNGSTGFSGDGGAATAAPAYGPRCVCVDGAGNIYISDWLNYRIRKINRSGIITTIAGNGSGGFPTEGATATASPLPIPNAIAADASGNLYFTSGGHKVLKIDVSGIITTIAGTGTASSSGDGGPATAATLNNPWGLVFDGSGNLFVTEESGHRIRKITSSGMISTFAGTGTSGSSGDGGAATAARVTSPTELRIDGAGNIYFKDNYANIRKINTTGIITTVAGNGTNGFSSSTGPATSMPLGGSNFAFTSDVSGNLFVADGNYSVRAINTSGTVSTYAGGLTYGFHGDGGAAINALFSGARGLAIDNFGNLLVIDQDNNRIRMITPPSGSVAPITGAGAVQVSHSATLSDFVTGGVWTSSNTSVATIGSSTGVVTGVTAGTATITYTIPASGCLATRSIVVTTTAPRIIQSVEGTAEDYLSLYPNPTAINSFNVKVSTAGLFAVYAVDGREIGTYNVQDGINMIELPEAVAPGLYVGKFKGIDGFTTSVKIIYASK